MSANTPYIDPDTRAILEKIRARMASRPGATEIPVSTLRARAAEELGIWNTDGPALPRVEDREVPGPVGPVAVRLYYPADHTVARPTLVYFHGGGWVIGSLETEDYSLRLLARESGCNIVSVDYRLAPEHKFPAGLEDCVAAIKYLEAHGAEWGIDTRRLAVGGASAGANLALATALALRDGGDGWLRYVLLFYGAFAPGLETESHRLYGGKGQYFLDSETMAYFWSCYLNDDEERANPLAVPLEASLAGLPPVHLMVAELDPLRDDSLELHHRLMAAGVPVECVRYPGVLHGFTVMARDLPEARNALKAAGESLRTALQDP